MNVVVVVPFRVERRGDHAVYAENTVGEIGMASKMARCQGFDQPGSEAFAAWRLDLRPPGFFPRQSEFRLCGRDVP